MKIVVASFEKDKQNRLLADYKSLSDEVNVTEFLNKFLESKYITDLKVFEEDEEIVYREIKYSSIKSISIKLDEKGKNMLNSIKETSGKNKRQELIDKLEDIFYLNILLKKFCQELLDNKNKNKNEIKLIII